jgi:DNA-binding transcriptional LysR family regulator
VLGSVAEAAAAVSQANTVGEAGVAIGTFGSPHHYDLADMIGRFLGEHPRATVRVVGRNSSTTAEAVRSGALDAAVVALPIDSSGLDVRPLFTGEVFYVSADAARTGRPVTIEDLGRRPFILYEASAGTADPTRFQLAARAQAAGVQLRPRIEVESADIALELAVAGLGDTYVPQILLPRLDARLSTVSFDPPLVDSFALVTRAGSRLSRPVEDFVIRVTEHLVERVGSAEPPA